MSTIDSHGNVHLRGGTPGAGQFAGRRTIAPEGTLDAPPSAATRIRSWWAEHQLVTAAENDMLAAFELAHPHPTADDYRTWLENVPGEWVLDRCGDEIEVFDREERRDAVRALSARFARGQAGVLVEAGSLDSGDRIDLARLWADSAEDASEFAASEFGVVDGPASETREGDTIVPLRNFPSPVVVPTGTVLPVQGARFRGEEFTERQLATRLVRDGMAPNIPGELPCTTISNFIAAAGLTESDPDYPEVLL